MSPYITYKKKLSYESYFQFWFARLLWYSLYKCQSVCCVYIAPQLENPSFKTCIIYYEGLMICILFNFLLMSNGSCLVCFKVRWAYHVLISQMFSKQLFEGKKTGFDCINFILQIWSWRWRWLFVMIIDVSINRSVSISLDLCSIHLSL